VKVIVPPQGLILNIFKPAGMTSFEVVRKIRRKLNVKKVGHCGTLDPFAEGVLIILVGKATKLAPQFTSYDKTYRCRIRLGRSTDTYDITGRVIKESETVKVTIEDIKSIIKKFKGEIRQIPPMFSAIKKAGRPLYILARQGLEIERESRIVKIYDLILESWQNPFLELTVHCSKGTYIRSLANDIGEDLGCGGCLERLARTAVGTFRMEDSLKLEEID
jgi:tRNA pseudouridine55 synthase